MDNRMVNGPSLDGSPLTTAIRAPGGNTAGAGPQWNGAAGAGGLAWAGSGGARTKSRPAETNMTRMGPPDVSGRRCPVESDPQGARRRDGVLHDYPHLPRRRGVEPIELSVPDRRTAGEAPKSRRDMVTNEAPGCWWPRRG